MLRNLGRGNSYDFSCMTRSADIWSVACTVIEMATGKAPWSDQFQEVGSLYFFLSKKHDTESLFLVQIMEAFQVSALFHIGTTKSHPPIPENLSHAAQDFLHKCLQE
jgi:serine/threonine protein kinase